MIAGSDIGNGSARALTESPGCALICAIRERRVGSASAENVRSRARASYLTIKLTICCRQKPVKASRDSHQLRPEAQSVDGHCHRESMSAKCRELALRVSG